VDAAKQPVHIPNPSGTLTSSQDESFQLRKWGGLKKQVFSGFCALSFKHKGARGWIP